MNECRCPVCSPEGWVPGRWRVGSEQLHGAVAALYPIHVDNEGRAFYVIREGDQP